MKQFLSILTAAVGLTMTAHADLGDTYAQSCRRFGTEGQIDRQNHAMLWKVPDLLNGYWVVSETFRNNQCVCIVYTSSEASNALESAIWKTLQMNSLSTHVWKEYWRHDDGQRDFSTTDGKLFGSARLSDSGHQMIRVAYASYLKAHDLFEVPSPTVSEKKAPVEDNI